MHELKIWTEYFNAVKKYDKRFEIRKNDRNFQVGDTLLLKEWNPQTGEYTGQNLKVNVLYMITTLSGYFIISGDDYVILSISEPYDIKAYL